MNNSSLLDSTNVTDFQLRYEFASCLHFGKNLINGLFSIKCFQLIVNYVQSKPPGQKSSIDTLTVILVRNLQLLAIFAILFNCTRDCTLDSGELLAQILMWPVFNLPDSLITLLFVNSVFHQLLILRPHLIEKDFSSWFKVLGVIIITYMVSIDVYYLYVNQIQPPSYYALRRLPIKAEGLLFRRTILSICLISTTLLRINIALRNLVDRQPDSKVISEKCLMFLLLMISATSFILWIIGQQYRHAIFRVNEIIIFNIWPILIIFSNQKMRSFVIRKYQNEIDWMLVAFNKSMLSQACQRVCSLHNTFQSQSNVHPLLV